MKPIQEHCKVECDSFHYQSKWKEGMRLPSQEKGLERWFFQWQWRDPMILENTDKDSKEVIDNTDELQDNNNKESESGYYASYVIGAQWLDLENNVPVVVTTKYGCDKVDFLRMFDVCFNSGIEPEHFSRIYDVDMDQPRIEAPELNSVLSPLMVVHFLSIVQTIVKRGLKKDYVPRENNLNKVKSRIAIFRNERTNILKKRYDKVYCKYQDYSEDTPENRLIKKALLFSRQILLSSAASESMIKLQQKVNEFINAFSNVDEEIEIWEVKSIKHNKIFKEYNDAVKLAQKILLRFDYNVTNISSAEENKCPVFWIDMALLYEHYVLGLLKEAYPDKIKYQAKGYTGFPDFLCYDPKIVIDTKYIPRFNKDKLDVYIIRQLSGYARDRRIFKDKISDIIPCLIIYPEEGEPENPFKNLEIEDLLMVEDKRVWGFHRVAVPLPVLSIN